MFGRNKNLRIITHCKETSPKCLVSQLPIMYNWLKGTTVYMTDQVPILLEFTSWWRTQTNRWQCSEEIWLQWGTRCHGNRKQGHLTQTALFKGGNVKDERNQRAREAQQKSTSVAGSSSSIYRGEQGKVREPAVPGKREKQGPSQTGP